MAVRAFNQKIGRSWDGARQERGRSGTAPRRWVNVSRMERMLSVVAGGALAAYGLQRRQAQGGAAALAGAALLYRGSTGHCDVYSALGVDSAHPRGRAAKADRDSNTRQALGGSRGIHVEQAITINRPVGEVYRFWRNFEQLPQFMQHLESVAMREQGLSHWVAKAPAGYTVSWDARIINEVENKVIGWQSVDGSTVATAGSVHFDETPHGTRVRVHLQYSPPGGKLGAAIATLFGEEPTQQVREDMRRLKALLETGEIPRIDGQPSGRASDRGRSRDEPVWLEPEGRAGQWHPSAQHPAGQGPLHGGRR